MSRPRKYTPNTLKKAVNGYFDSISRLVPLTEKRDTGRKDRDGHVIYEEVPVLNRLGVQATVLEYLVPPTVGGLCEHLGIHRSTWADYCDAQLHPEFSDTTTHARGRMRAWLEEQLLTRKDVKGIVFDLQNNYGYVEVRRVYDDSVICDRFRIVEKYRSMENEEKKFDLYHITDHYRYTEITQKMREEMAQTREASEIAFVAMAEKGDLDDATAGEHMALFPEWAYPTAYKTGQYRTFKGKLYRCLQDHTSQASWEPSYTTSLWVKASDPSEEWPAWSQPLGAHDSYAKGAKVTHNGKKWTSDVDGNVWEPGVSQWTEVTA